MPNATRVYFAALIVSALSTSIACSGSAASGTSAKGGGGGRGGRGGGGGAQPVITAKVGTKDVPVDIAAVGAVEAFATITVRSQVTGQLEQVLFQEGDLVKKGQTLFTIDKRPFEAALQQAEANLTRDEALLAQSEAQLARDTATANYQRLSFERQGELVERGIISKDTGQQAGAQAEASAAIVNADKAAVESAKAQLNAQRSAVETTRVQLTYCTISSPIDGRAGDLAIKGGNLVTANTTQLTTIAQIEPIYVTFSVPATHLPTIKQHMGAAEKLAVTATPQDADAKPAEGKLTFLDNLVDQTTDTIKLKGTFDNHDRALWPGQFARVSLRLATIPNATVVSQQAVQTGQDGQFVFVVNSDSVVDQRPVTVAERVGDDIVISKGLKAGETVVTEGQLRLEQGTRVQVSDANGNLTPGPGGRGRRGGGQGQGGQEQGGQGGQGRRGDGGGGQRGQ